MDPRDASWEISSPTYRVYFWRAAEAPSGTPGHGGWSSDEWRLTGARDLHEVLEWADLRSAGRSYTLHVEVDVAEGRGLVNLAGVDPTRP